MAFDDRASADLLEKALTVAGLQAITAPNSRLLLRQAQENRIALLIMEARFDGQDGLALSKEILKALPSLPIIIYAPQPDASMLRRALQTGVMDVLSPPLRMDEITATIQNTLNRAQRLGDWLRQEIKRSTASLRQHSEALETLLQLGRSIASSLEINQALANIVSAAVDLLKAEEGSLLLVDPESGELYVRASKNFDQQLVSTLRLPIHDSLAGQAIRSRKPIIINSEAAQKIKTSYLVHSVIYVPLQTRHGVIGVLSVDNRTIQRDFTQEQLVLLSILADYAAIALENAQLYDAVKQERNKLDAVFRHIKNGVLILDHKNRIMLINPAARETFHLEPDAPLEGLAIQDVVQNEDLLSLLNRSADNALTYHEINTDDQKIYSAQFTPIPGLGAAITLHDITYLKDLDQLKTDFIHTVSHDLRSPLTAVLGYAELLERVGPLTAQQEEFVRRIQMSVQSITELVNDLLDLGRIESGFDTRKEQVHLKGVLEYVLANLQVQVSAKHQTLDVQIDENVPPVKGNPIRLRQMMDNLIGNAIKYTQDGGEIKVRLFTTDGQVIFEVSDNGPGIPVEDQPHIFEKFYRGDQPQTQGSGLGLAIVKSIVDSHAGRIWVNSIPGQGATFTVVLPTSETSR